MDNKIADLKEKNNKISRIYEIYSGNNTYKQLFSQDHALSESVECIRAMCIEWEELFSEFTACETPVISDKSQALFVRMYDNILKSHTLFRKFISDNHDRCVVSNVEQTLANLDRAHDI